MLKSIFLLLLVPFLEKGGDDSTTSYGGVVSASATPSPSHTFSALPFKEIIRSIPQKETSVGNSFFMGFNISKHIAGNVSGIICWENLEEVNVYAHKASRKLAFGGEEAPDKEGHYLYRLSAITADGPLAFPLVLAVGAETVDVQDPHFCEEECFSSRLTYSSETQAIHGLWQIVMRALLLYMATASFFYVVVTQVIKCSKKHKKSKSIQL